MAEFSEQQKKQMALKAMVDSGVLGVYEAFTAMHALQSQINNLIEKVLTLDKKVLALEEAECPHCKHVEREHD